MTVTTSRRPGRNAVRRGERLTDFRALTDVKLHGLFAELRGTIFWKVVRLLFCGLSPREALGVRVRDLDADGGILRVRAKRTGRKRARWFPRQLRYELYHESLDKHPGDPLFSVRGAGPRAYRPLGVSSVQHALRVASEKVGLAVTVQLLQKNLIYRLVRWGYSPHWIAGELAVSNRRQIESVRRTWLRETVS